ncbi:DUF4306 domain-containing protein [Alkalihalobacillus sp. CinArs1]|uniref:DUF4306 domain-containing protein n=1 Tax=Alkalihalobacillus sp. CinArs1 TaxID=2995314 RepID=UPI0022DE19F6|nr:DUF4306 domain-containing protein [Alkalihalobacillus sp. CinArs1]
MVYIIQYIFSVFMVFFSGFVTWYEGSELRDKPWEWGYSAIFSKIMIGKVTVENDISGLDHFIYAAKFKPVFPLLFTISLLYLFIVIAWNLLRSNMNLLVIFHSALGGSLLVLSLLIVESPTMGLNLFTWFFVVTGILNFFIAVILRVRVNYVSMA